MLLVNGTVKFSRSVLGALDGCADVPFSVNDVTVDFGTSVVNKLDSELLFCQNSVKLKPDVIVENKVFLSVPVVVGSSVALSVGLVSTGYWLNNEKGGYVGMFMLIVR